MKFVKSTVKVLAELDPRPKIRQQAKQALLPSFFRSRDIIGGGGRGGGCWFKKRLS